MMATYCWRWSCHGIRPGRAHPARRPGRLWTYPWLTWPTEELQEEIGYRAGRLDYLGELWPWAKYLAVRSFLARELTPSKLMGDEGYEVGVEQLPLAELETVDRRWPPPAIAVPLPDCSWPGHFYAAGG